MLELVMRFNGKVFLASKYKILIPSSYCKNKMYNFRLFLHLNLAHNYNITI